MSSDQAVDSFVHELGMVLRHLYDPSRLRLSPLSQLFALDCQEEPGLALRRFLAHAIDALKPDSVVPLDTKAWRFYRILLFRHIEQFGQTETAANLSLSTRQLRRDEGLALRLLADYLWSHYDLEAKWKQLDYGHYQRDNGLHNQDVQTPSLEQELESLETSLWQEMAEADGFIQTAAKIASPLARDLAVGVSYSIQQNLPPLAVQPTAMRQSLLNALIAAIRSAPGGNVEIKAEMIRGEIHITISPFRHSSSLLPLSTNEEELLKVGQDLMRLSGGSFEIETGTCAKHPFTVRLIIPTVGQIPILAIDDNIDTLHLLQRCFQGSRYRFIGTRDPNHAIELADESDTQIILLDVMLPDVDGWELLGKLREHPKTRNIPIIVCTVLPQEQLALALGAAQFIRKPVGRKAILSALDRQLSLPQTESG